MSLSVIFEILGLFANTVTADDKYFLCKSENLYRNQFKCKYLRNKKNFPNVLLHFWNLNQILNILIQTMNLIAYVFPKLEIAKNVIR